MADQCGGGHYQVHFNQDVPGNDLRNAGTSDLCQLVRQCDADPQCRGFNLGGWLKNSAPGTNRVFVTGSIFYSKTAPPPVHIHRTPTECLVDVGQPTQTIGRLSEASPSLIWEGANGATKVVGEYRGGQCSVTVEQQLVPNEMPRRKTVRSFTPLLGVGRDTSLSPGNMVTVTGQTQSGTSELVTNVKLSTRPEVLATKNDPLPPPPGTVGADGADGADDETFDDFFPPKRPPPPEALIPRIRRMLKRHQNMVVVTIVLALAAVGAGLFLWRRRRK